MIPSRAASGSGSPPPRPTCAAGCKAWRLRSRVQESLKRDPHGDLYIFRGRRGDLVKILWHDGLSMSLYAKRFDRGKFIWPSASDGAVSISPAQMIYIFDHPC